jgi:MFS family permease
LKQLSAASRRVLLAVAGLTLLGLALRLARYEQSIFGDETSTLYIVDGRSLSDVLSLISGDAEISPPLYFILAWLSTKLGSAPELVRLPSLIAGTASIPLVYLVGARALNRNAGLIAAAVMALSPFMIFYSADGRGYAVAIALLLGSTLAMLAGARTGRARWWVAYGVLSLLAMYTHYTAAFVLVAQLAWLLWAHPECRKPALIANLAAAMLYLPWVPDLLDDTGSPTIEILSALQGSGFAAKRLSVEVWAIGYPFRSPHQLPGTLAAVLGLAGFVVAAAAGLVRHLQRRKAVAAGGSDDAERPALLSKGMVLVIALAASTAVCELVILLLTGNDLFGARNLTTSSAALALLIGGVLASAGRSWGTICTIMVIACFGIGAARTLQTTNELVDFKSAAAYVDSAAGPDDVIVDLLSPRVTPVPLTSLDAYLPQGRAEFRPLLPEGEPPFLPSSPIPESAELLSEAVRDAQGERLVLLVSDTGLVRDGDDVTAIRIEPIVYGTAPVELFELPPGSRVADEVRFPALGPVNVVVVEPGRLPPD